MSKSHDVSDFLRMHGLILKEISLRLPELRRELERDYVRLQLVYRSRGDAVFLLDLPAIGKCFLKALSTGTLTRMGLPLSRCDHNSVIPRLYKGLWKRAFTDDGCLRSDIDPYVVKSMQMLFFMFKKFERKATDSALYETTQEFFDVDESLPPPSFDWLGGPNFVDNACAIGDCQGPDTGLFSKNMPRSDLSDNSELLDTIQRVADVVSSTIGVLDLGVGRHGPGAVSESRFGISKFGIRNWPSRLWGRFNPSGFFSPIRSSEIFCEDERASVLIAVPKTMKGPRLIAKEPTTNLYCQFAVAEALEDWIETGPLRNSITLRDQSNSSSLALQSSEDHKFGTIDLKSASDRLSLWLVERLFRRNRDLLENFHAVRTAFCDLSIDKKLPRIIRLRKFATQGTALTFPVQSIVFTIICIGVLAYKEGVKRIDSRVIARIGKSVRVYGDDILVPTDMVESVCMALELLYLKVNRDKTHYKGSFREACGIDAFAGVDVTPTYISIHPTVRPDSVGRLVEMSNNAYLRGWTLLAEYIRRSVPDYRSIPVVPDTGSGFIAFVRDGYLPPSNIKLRWNSALQRVEGFLLTAVTLRRLQKVDAPLSLASFLALAERRADQTKRLFDEAVSRYPWFIEPWRPLSRVEVLASEARRWVPFHSENYAAVRE